jgi:Fe-S-cluster containining protein
VTVCVDGCGACCDPVSLPYTLREMLTDPAIPADQRQWAARSLTPMSPREAFRIAPWLRGRLQRVEGRLVPTFYFRCRHFDRETRRCTDYENRPLMCREYPWYDGQVPANAALPPTCSFRADIGEVPVAITPRPQPIRTDP